MFRQHLVAYLCPRTSTARPWQPTADNSLQALQPANKALQACCQTDGLVMCCTFKYRCTHTVSILAGQSIVQRWEHFPKQPVGCYRKMWLCTFKTPPHQAVHRLQEYVNRPTVQRRHRSKFAVKRTSTWSRRLCHWRSRSVTLSTLLSYRKPVHDVNMESSQQHVHTTPWCATV